ncbi:MAG: SpoIID/LytB domain-containing protein [Calditrichaceae bacterium]
MDGINTVIDPDSDSTCTWRIKIKESEPAVFSYFLVLKTSMEKDIILESYDKYKSSCDLLNIKESGGDVYYLNRFITSNHTYKLMAGPFNTEKEARYFCRNFSHLNHCNIHRKCEKKGSGIIEIFDLSGDFYAEVENSLKFTPVRNEEYFEIKNFRIPVCGEEEKTRQENLFYQGGLNILIGEDRSLAASNQIPLDLYVKGVLTSEIGEQNSAEFIKSMAVVIRSHLFAKYGREHFDEEYDFCSSAHCLRYYGVKPASDKIDTILKQTDGILLERDNNIDPAYFSYSCGGHTEQSEPGQIKNTERRHNGKFDCDSSKGLNYKLETEIDVENWIYEKPDVFCRELNQASNIAPDIATNSFRWEVFYTRQDLENIIKFKTGVDPGIIYEITPVKRGVSGRLNEIEILGSLKNLKIEGESNIRSALSYTSLQSSCFIVKYEHGEDGIPLSFTLIGAGNGHGSGLCKVGAAKMASDNKSMEVILNHYFEDSVISKKY